MAPLACHMIATRDLLYTSSTFGAVAYISITRSPSIEILIHSMLALDFSMPLHSTLETNFVATLAGHLILLPFSHEMGAIWSRTPTQIWV